MVAQNGGPSSSDFVRKLYNMLKDPENKSIVRWGTGGDTFVVLESETFTKSVLPKHFKHSNFSSFVRQLNKYDFHKVRRGDDNRESPYGPNTWEFKHPEFRVDRKNNLDNIRRKAPTPRKVNPSEESLNATQQQLAVMAEMLSKTQQQVQELRAELANINDTNKLLVNEVAVLHKMIITQKQTQQELVSYLDNQKAKSASTQSGDDAELCRARELLASSAPNSATSIVASVASDVNMKRMQTNFGAAAAAAAAAADSAGTPLYSATTPMMPLMNDPLAMTRFAEYPVNETVNMDPFNADSMAKMPFPIPPNGGEMQPAAPSDPIPEQSASPAQSTDSLTEWSKRPPLVYLVEDDKTCSKIGVKFLKSLGCKVEVATDGLQAVTETSQNGSRFDLIFMDIVMPKLDGVSATACIRSHLPTVPIIAMTSNIRAADITHYLQHGMTDVLAKPFTRDRMLKILKKHLREPLKSPPDAMGPVNNTLTMSPALSNVAIAAPPPLNTLPLKFEPTPNPSPSTTTAWQSPRQLALPATSAPGSIDNNNFLTLGANANNPNSHMLMGTPSATSTTTAMPQRGGFPAMGPPTMGRVPNIGSMEEPPEKRPRLFGPEGMFVQ